MGRSEVGGFWRRGLALALDAVAGLLFLLPGIVVLAAGPTQLTECAPSGSGLCEEPTDAVAAAGLVLVLGGGLVWLLLHIGLTAVAGGSPGKLVLGLRVIRSTGGPVTRWVAFGRLLASYLSTSFLAAGYLFALFNDDRETFHDRLAKTRVLRADRGDPAAATPDLRRALAVSALTLAVAGALAAAAGTTPEGLTPAELLAAGSGTAGVSGSAAVPGDTATVPYDQLEPGDCLVADPDYLAASEVVVVVDCAEQHIAEVTGSGSLEGGPWPGEEVIVGRSRALCAPTFRDRTGLEWWNAVSGLFYVGPDEAAWPTDRYVLCVAYLPEPATGRLAELEPSAWPHLVASGIAAPGTCAQITKELPGPLTVVDCNEPHEIEVLPGSPIDLPSFEIEAVELRADELCRESFAAYVGVSYDASALEMVYSYPSDDYRFERKPTASCFVKKSDVVGTVRGTRR